MNICVLGLWHLGTVTAACLAAGGHRVVGLDFDPAVVSALQAGQPPIFEPGLEELVQQGINRGMLSFSGEAADTLGECELVWVAYDTPVDDEDHADVQFVVDQVQRVFPNLKRGTLVLISSQVPVGTTRQLARAYAAAYPTGSVSFAYSPENLRLGKAIQVFTQPDRVVAGVDSEIAVTKISTALQPFTNHIEWMSIESAEMTKHALNAFLAISVTFANEIATLCEALGADAKEVERGLKTEVRIGPGAYLGPGAAFAGGTLARDVQSLIQLGTTHQQPMVLMNAVQTSNERHKHWVQHKLSALIGDLKGKRMAVLGLTYKPGTDTLRRSTSVELCQWLAQQGALVVAYDPAVRSLPSALATDITLAATLSDALTNAAALIVSTAWPDFLHLTADEVYIQMSVPLIIDASRFLNKTLGSDARLRYFTVGKG